jgi:polysaccharide export outer membrane protein
MHISRRAARPAAPSIRIIALAAALALLTSAALHAQTLPDYKLHPGDKVILGVYDDPKLLPQEITITPDGKVSYPLVGVLMAGGKTVEQLRAEMETRLKKYIAEPIATVMVTQVLGNVIYVIGQVNKPGLYVMNPTLNVLQSLALAGGGNPYAKLDGIVIIRSSGGTQRQLPFRYSAVSSGRDLAENVQLESGDVVVVP